MEMTFEQWWSNVGGGGDMEKYSNVWNAAQNAMVERFTSTNKASTQCSLYASCKYPIKSCCCTGVPICHKQ